MKSGTFSLLSRADYFEQVRREAARAKRGDRVLVSSMTLTPADPLIQDLLDGLTAAARNGADVTFLVDAHSFLLYHEHLPGPLLFHRELPQRMAKPFQRKADALATLQDAGVEVAITNVPDKRLSNPFGGRSHIKAAIINDYVFVGGCNLSESDQSDIMVGWHDTADADWLYDRMHHIAAAGNVQTVLGAKDLSHKLDNHANLLIDVGVPGQSRIFEEALRAIDEAEDWLIITCQFFPNNFTAKHLQRAHARGVRVFPLFNHHSRHNWPQSWLQAGVTQFERLRMPHSFFAGELPKTSPKLHAKLIATEKEALVGSHNYVRAGVNFGTAEIALHVKDPTFAHDSAQFMLDLLGLQNDKRFTFLK